ncbi:MAG: DNA replication and repair protein RecF [Vampirovibrionales bacterium]|nr:DNA replication and repair protein RecF [Vampirovibrionales bacterium]
MYVASLKLEHVRNFTHLVLEPSGGRNLLLGHNGHGKTNVLEMIALLSRGRSHRATSEKELIQWGHTTASMEALLASHDTNRPPIHITGVFHRDPLSDRLQTKLQVNGVTLEGRSQLVGLLPSVSFFPEDAAIAREAPALRRQWVDTALTQRDSSQIKHLQRYQAVRKQKAELLKQLAHQPCGSAMEQLALWNQTLAEAAAPVLLARLHYLQACGPVASHQYELLCDSTQEPFTLGYGLAGEGFDPEVVAGLQQPKVWQQGLPDDWQSPTFWQQRYQQALTAAMAAELARQQCLIGPHRDDVILMVKNQWVTMYGSQGQQRSVVLALKLAELNTLQTHCAEPPILLLDDALAELDPKRQRFLTQLLQTQSQQFITTPSLSSGLFDKGLDPAVTPITPTQVYHVSDGVVSQSMQELSDADLTEPFPANLLAQV